MIDQVEELVSLLRDELTRYGEMLALLDQQQDYVIQRATEDLLQSLTAIQSQSDAINRVRANRENLQSRLGELACPGETPDFENLLPVLPADYRPLIEALVEENNSLLQRVQQRARQNHLLLSRSVELMQDFINSLLPSSALPTYTPKGKKSRTDQPGTPLYEAIG